MYVYVYTCIIETNRIANAIGKQKRKTERERKTDKLTEHNSIKL